MYMNLTSSTSREAFDSDCALASLLSLNFDAGIMLGAGKGSGPPAVHIALLATLVMRLDCRDLRRLFEIFS